MRIVPIIICLVFSLPYKVSAQSLKGKVYDGTTTVKGIKIYNKTQKSLTATDDKGEFNLPAKVGDTLALESLFHHPKVEILKPYHFDGIAIFELKKIINTLDEVEIKSEPEQPVFEEETYNIELQNLIKEDIKNNPEKYRPQGATYGVNFLAIIGLVSKLIKKKKKYKAPTYTPITYERMDSLFSKSSFFNERLLVEDLKIPVDKIQLFKEFCAAKYISGELLKEEKKMELLEKLVLNSQLFLILLEQYTENTSKKD